MKFLCNTEFIHSGQGIYFSGTVYPLTVEDAGKLIALDKKKPLGALSFFTPVDEEAAGFIKAAGSNGGIAQNPGQNKPPAPPDTEESDTPKAATRSGLILEAKNLGIKGADRMNVDELKEVIGAAKVKRQTAEPAAPESDLV
jgi:hypothetical protein